MFIRVFLFLFDFSKRFLVLRMKSFIKRYLIMYLRKFEVFLENILKM